MKKQTLSELAQNIISEKVNIAVQNIRSSIKNNKPNLNKFAELVRQKQENVNNRKY